MNSFIEKCLGPVYHPVIRNIRLKKAIKNLNSSYCNYISNNQDDAGRFLVDITLLNTMATGTGIDRVVKSFMKELNSLRLCKKVLYVYSKTATGFYEVSTNKKILLNSNDTLFIAECNFCTLIDNRKILLEAHKQGTKIYSFVYDLIPIILSKTVDFNKKKRFPAYLESALKFDGIFSDSKSVSEDIKKYIENSKLSDYNKNIILDYSYLGSSFKKQEECAADKNKPPVFLMVSTVEPRKKYDQVLKAFSRLWKQGYNIQLKIVGRPGWKNKKTIKKLETSPYLNKKLFWYKTGISDEELSTLYKECTAVIFASLSEGYGLALVEAANYSKPLIVRDIPVFREIAEDSVLYFNGLKPEAIENAVKEFLTQHKNGTTKMPKIKQNTWHDFTEKLLKTMELI